jgi:radical SAM protein with 4Fe4S-binding SPASM domain
MNERLQNLAETLVTATRDYIFVRPEDGLLILRPNRIHHLNPTAVEMLGTLFRSEPVDVAGLVESIAGRYAVPPAQVERDLEELLNGLQRLLRGEPPAGPALRCTPFGTHAIRYPVLSEIALTYRCNNRCSFCYASAPERGKTVREMSTGEVELVIDKIACQAKAATISFTGGEPTLRADLPELVAHARTRGLRTNLITNGIRCADAGLVASLKEAGLDSAQLSLEAADAEIHNRIAGNPHAFEATVQGLRNLLAAGIHSHTNTTINRQNRDHLHALVDFLAGMGQSYLSMNMVIRTGGGANRIDGEIGYPQIGPVLLDLKAHAEARGMRFVWYSPVPLCLFNPAQHGLGSQSCAAADGLLSVNPAGEVLPCSSFEGSLGNLLEDDFQAIWHTRRARYWRRKEFLPPDCRGCDMAELCCGACPLYWDAAGSFAELRGAAPGHVQGWQRAAWRARRRWIGQAKGVGGS